MVYGIDLMKHGDSDVLHVIELQEDNASGIQIRVREHAAAINPIDILARNGQIAATKGILHHRMFPGWT